MQWLWVPLSLRPVFKEDSNISICNVRNIKQCQVNRKGWTGRKDRLWITVFGICSLYREESWLQSSFNYQVSARSRCREDIFTPMKVYTSFKRYIKRYMKRLSLLGLTTSIPSLLFSPILCYYRLPLSRSLKSRAPSAPQCARDVPQCMTLDQSEGAIPKVYLLWLEPGNWRTIKNMRPQLTDSLWAPSHAACAGYHLPETGSLKAKSPPPKGKETETI